MTIGASYWDSLVVGATRRLGTHLFTAEEIRHFATLYDPQPFHLDEAAATASVLGGLCASGWHTAAIFMRLNAGMLNAEVGARRAAGEAVPAIGPSPGFRDLRWRHPVYAGDRVAYDQRIEGKRISASRPGWGLVETWNSGTNQDGRLVFEFKAVAFLGLT